MYLSSEQQVSIEPPFCKALASINSLKKRATLPKPQVFPERGNNCSILFDSQGPKKFKKKTHQHNGFEYKLYMDLHGSFFWGRDQDLFCFVFTSMVIGKTWFGNQLEDETPRHHTLWHAKVGTRSSYRSGSF